MQISIISPSGGIGRTVTTVNLGSTLAEIGERVLVVGLSSLDNLSTGFGLCNIEKTIFDVFTGEALTNDAIYSVDLSNRNWNGKIDVLPGDSRLIDTELTKITKKYNNLLLHNVLKQVKDNYDFILFDCPRSDWLIINNALLISDYALVPFQVTNSNNVRHIADFFERIKELKNTANSNLELLGFYNNYEKEIEGFEHNEIKLRRLFGENLLNTKISYSNKIMEAENCKTPINK
ncbi:MAG: ParA family protein, partial [bacterium]